MKFIPYGKQHLYRDDIDAVLKVLKSDFLTQGPFVQKFEYGVSKYCGSNYSVAVNSATSALHLACMALDLGKDDYVWTSPNSFVASANCALYCDAKIDFVDIDPETWCMSPEYLEEKLKMNINNKLPIPKIVIPVHLAGQSCEMLKIKRLSDKYGFKIIEDASHAIGGYYNNSAVGSCKYSDITVFSFHPVKIITSGEGGMALTNCKKIFKKLKSLRTHGINKDPINFINKSKGSWYYEQTDLGYNYRLTDIQAALGLSQLKKLDYFTEKRNEKVKIYHSLLKDSSITLQKMPNNVYSARHLFIIRVPEEIHKSVFDYLKKTGIGVNMHYLPIHLQPYYQKLGFKKGQFPKAEKYGNEAISLPIFPKLQKKELLFIIKSLKEIYEKEIKKIK